MASLNKVMLMGNLTRDPEIRYTTKGSAMVDIGLAINRRYKLDTGETREEVVFVDVTFWGRKGEVVSQYFKKGNPIYVEGRLQLDTWDDKSSGQKRSKLRVIGETFEFLGGKGGGQSPPPDHGDEAEGDAPPQRASNPSRQGQPPRPASPQDAADGPSQEMDSDDIPF